MLDAFHEDLWGGTGGSFDWGLVPEGMARPIILSGGLTASNVAGAVRRTRPYAVDVSSSVEASKGIKDAAKIAAVIGAVKQADGGPSGRGGASRPGWRRVGRGAAGA